MADTENGILAWCTSIRTTLANDPVRQRFEEQVQTHGFLFLDDYLAGIRAGPKKDPIIELVKTPSRKRGAPKRTRADTAAAVKMKSVISMSLEDTDDAKENVLPVNSFHQALLQVKHANEDSRLAKTAPIEEPPRQTQIMADNPHEEPKPQPQEPVVAEPEKPRNKGPHKAFASAPSAKRVSRPEPVVIEIDSSPERPSAGEQMETDEERVEVVALVLPDAPAAVVTSSSTGSSPLASDATPPPSSDISVLLQPPASPPPPSPVIIATSVLPIPDTLAPPQPAPRPSTPRSNGNDLSIIAEGDESAERSRLSGQLPPLQHLSNPPSPICGPVELADNQEIATQPQLAVEIVAHNGDSDIGEDDEQFETSPVGLDDHEMTQATRISGFSPTRTFQTVPAPPSPAPSGPTQHTAPLPKIHQEHNLASGHEDGALTAPLPSIPASSSSSSETFTVPLRDPDSPPNTKTLVRKPSVSIYPSLPAPSPLRKSMRVAREPSIGVGVLQSGHARRSMAGTSAPALGKRTSWLTKAREAKALDVTVKRVITHEVVPPQMASGSGVKRKSGDMLASGDDETQARVSEERERESKVAKVDAALATKGKQREITEPTVTSVVRPPASQPQLPPSQSHPTLPQIEPILAEVEPVQKAPLPPFEPVRNAPTPSSGGGFLDRFKKTVEGLGKIGKSMGGKSMGGAAAAAALAEAKAKAEAMVAERHKVQEDTPDPMPVIDAPEATTSTSQGKKEAVFTKETFDTEHFFSVPPAPPKESDKRLSVSDLAPAAGVRSQGKEVEKAFSFPPANPVFAPPSLAAYIQETSSGSRKSPVEANLSTSTTPPTSPPSRKSKSSFVAPSGPVFNPPPRVFVPPPAAKEPVFKLPVQPFSFPAAMAMGLPAKLAVPDSLYSKAAPLSAQSSTASLISDAVFDTDRDAPAWMPSTQETEYFESQPQSQNVVEPAPEAGSRQVDDDDDDSWRLDKKFAEAHPMWTPFGFVDKDDEATWSTQPTQSHKGDTGPIAPPEPERGNEGARVEAEVGPEQDIAAGSDMDIDDFVDDGRGVVDDLEDEMDITHNSTLGTLEPKPLHLKHTRSQSQMSMASSSSSQAGKLAASGIGSKKHVKSIKLAAAAAKKQQEEQDKKSARVKEMENRRQLIIQRKAEEEKTRAIEEEKKRKEEVDRRKREREEHTDKRPLKLGTKKVEEDTTTKKRKVTVDVEKKPESKKPPSKDKKDVLPARATKPSLAAPSAAPKSIVKPTTTFKQPAIPSSANGTNPSSTAAAPSKLPSSNQPKAATASSTKSKGKGKAPEDGMDDPEPSRTLQGQMAARVQAQIQASKQQQRGEPVVASESIELPDINSEYSDSDDEDRKRTFDPPNWAQSPHLRQALQEQSSVNPDDIFGPVRPLQMEEIFRTRHSRFRARTSSANWSGADQLTAQEEREYARRMGYQ
ncbi:hypothetical protein JAAARDRAFT_169466 [Jaapia argillacea MUCL 33604]|uniref:Inner centromere protein ARK-binding domain-containing protein n=1 Tax=Jaapia argillacea MUCL 33604 TaxID=933084 RepID=A0A067QJ50_9AGAM|nr:hypothetical protein JAAARDRAFT_169466 [Jaapia argillacea MUCL 33604]